MRHRNLGLAIFICLAMLTTPCFGTEIKYSHKIDVEKMSFHWEVAGTVLHVKLTAKTTGWVGIGFNPSEAMQDANFILGYVKNGEAKVTDDYGTSYTKHQQDSKLGGQKNISNVVGKEENGMTEIRFTIPLNSGDAKDKALSIDTETVVLLAYGAGRDSFKARHKFRTTLKVNLKTGAFSK
ncbi:MAG: DOMON domain-containing protein [Desulfobacterales bacterium]|uniref:DOMON domain-containing protein n=1 Tax=Candidatus Desulfatibia vada TaxID=2841696 RepID=A0A8J6TPH7_9BACT|nr:DOMON domain-containing protein [Candidatus Desulfatibia vada]